MYIICLKHLCFFSLSNLQLDNKVRSGFFRLRQGYEMFHCYEMYICWVLNSILHVCSSAKQLNKRNIIDTMSPEVVIVFWCLLSFRSHLKIFTLSFVRKMSQVVIW